MEMDIKSSYSPKFFASFSKFMGTKYFILFTNYVRGFELGAFPSLEHSKYYTFHP
jgi:hypothetical protein